MSPHRRIVFVTDNVWKGTFCDRLLSNRTLGTGVRQLHTMVSGNTKLCCLVDVCTVTEYIIHLYSPRRQQVETKLKTNCEK